MTALGVAEVAVAVVVVGGVASYWIVGMRDEARHERAILKEHARAKRAHFAAVEAAEINPSFSPDAIKQSVTQVVALADSFWRAGGRGALEGCPMPVLSRPGHAHGKPGSAAA